MESQYACSCDRSIEIEPLYWRLFLPHTGWDLSESSSWMVGHWLDRLDQALSNSQVERLKLLARCRWQELSSAPWPSLLHLDLSNHRGSLWPLLAKVPNLQQLEMRERCLAGALVGPLLAPLRELRRLDLRGCQLEGELDLRPLLQLQLLLIDGPDPLPILLPPRAKQWIDDRRPIPHTTGHGHYAWTSFSP